MDNKLTKSQVLFETIQRLMRRESNPHIRRLLNKSHHSEIASVIRQLSTDDGIEVLDLIPNLELKAETLSELEGDFFVTYFIHKEDPKEVAEVLHKLPEDEAADLISYLEDEQKEQLLSCMNQEIKEEVVEILEYDEGTCGRIMAVDILALNQNLTAKEAIEHIQNTSYAESLFYIYVIDDYENLMGVISLRQLLQVEKKKKLSEFMTRDVIRVLVNDPDERAAEFIEEYNFVSLPVTDVEGKLVGMVTVDDIIDFIRDEAQDDVLQFAGAEKEAIDDFSFWRAFFSRGLWLAMLFFGGIFCMELIFYFYPQLIQEVLVLGFAPLVLRLSGSIAMQTVAFVDQSILDEDISRDRGIRALWGQNFVTLLVGFLLAVFVGLYLHLRFSFLNLPDYSLAIPAGIVLVSVFAILIGVLVPTISKWIKLEPLPASSKFVHFLMDALSLFVFLGFLLLWQNYGA